MIDEQMLSRRSVLITASCGAGGLVLLACGGAGDEAPPATAPESTASGTPAASTPTSAPRSSTPAPTTAASTPTSASAPSKSPSATGGRALVALADVPVGGAVSATGAAGAKLLVSQPTKGKAVAFDATCTHQGCPVSPGKGSLDCHCHGSVFDLATGVPTRGPATRPLAKVAVRVAGGQVVLGA